MSTNNPPPKSLYDLIAKTGDNITSLGTLTGFGDSPSINNDLGFIAFVGQSNNRSDLLVENGLGQITNLSVADSNNFSKTVQINNRNQVVARDTLSGGSAIRIWDSNNPGSFQVIGTGAFPIEHYDFENTFPFASLNNNNQAVFLATPEGYFPNIALATLRGTNFWGKRTYNEGLLSTQNARPMIADNGKVVVRAFSAIVLNDYELNPREIIAGNSSGFTYVGLSPGISDDGKIVTFYGELNDAGAKTLGLTPGNGIFASIETDSGARKITRIAGVAGNGHLDPGESHEDVNNNGKVDPGEDKGLITSFAKDERVGVNYRSVGDNNFGTVAYLAFNEGKESLFSSQFKISSSDSKITPLHPHIVAKVGVEAKLVSPDLTGVIQDLNIYDPVNDQGQVAFWLRTSTSQEAIVRANPILKPILILPGIGGSFPQSSEFKKWILNRGVKPDSLKIDSIARTYDDLIETLKRAGYTEGVNLFVANYDWRLNPAPIDGSVDGIINRSVEELTDDTYEYSVDHLAFWLKEAVKGWGSQFPNVSAADIPELDSVDIIAHSMGGLVTRSYIQSDGYNGVFEFVDDKGNTVNANLPKVNNFFMLGVPNRGASLAWNPLNDNFLGGSGALLLKLVSQLAFKKVNKGETIALSGRNDLNGVITPPQVGTQLDPLAFIEQYVPTVRSLLATYPFFRGLSDSSETLRTIESIDPSQRNTLLLDLNNGFDSVAGDGDPNLFANLVEQVTVIYGTNENTRDAVAQRNEPDSLLSLPLVTIPKPSVLKLNDLLPGVPQGIWYKDEEGRAADPRSPEMQGDKTVPLLSAEGTFLDGRYQRENIELEAFTRRIKNKPGNTDDTIDHKGIVSNIDVQKLILESLGVSLEEEQISTNLEANNLFSNLINLGADSPDFSSVLFDPVEGFLVDSIGRRLGYTQQTGPITEIPNSMWLGEEDGIGFLTDLVEGPFQLQLTGLGEEYFVSVSLETEDGPGGIEGEGFLAQGEQKIVDIPVNNAPILDLNGSTQGIDFSTTGTLGATIALVDPSGVLTDSDSPNLQGATITLTNPTDNASEFLNATPVGNITIVYNPTTSTLTLSGSEMIANYQQVLKTVTYTNTATTPNRLPREIMFVVDDGEGFNNLSPVATTTLTLVDSTPGKMIEGTSRRDSLTGTDGDDIITGFQRRDRLTGKGGNDQFVYNSLADKRDLITDFEIGSDKIVLTNLLDSIGYSGSAPLGDGIVQTTSQRGNTFLQLDPDGFAGNARPHLFARVIGVTEAALNDVSNFVF